MRLLLITQKVDQNDHNLGFFHAWIERFAAQFESVTVICLQKGVFSLPANVKVFSLGKEERASRGRYLKRFYNYILKERRNYDVVLVHMNPIYAVLGGICWKLMGKRIFLWYTHRSVDLALRLGALFCTNIFTASKESCRLASDKVVVTGHGIDVYAFSPAIRQKRGIYEVLSVGRISSTKNILRMVEAFRLLKERGFKGRLSIIGDAVTETDHRYQKEVIAYIAANHLGAMINLVGPVRSTDTANWYHRSDMFVNLSTTGSIDKVVLEAMACGLQIVTSNEAFVPVLSSEHLTSNEPVAIAERISALATHPAEPALRAYVVANHSIDTLIPRLAGLMARS